MVCVLSNGSSTRRVVGLCDMDLHLGQLHYCLRSHLTSTYIQISSDKLINLIYIYLLSKVAYMQYLVKVIGGTC